MSLHAQAHLPTHTHNTHTHTYTHTHTLTHVHTQITGLHQITELASLALTDVWEPKQEGLESEWWLCLLITTACTLISLLLAGGC